MTEWKRLTSMALTIFLATGTGVVRSSVAEAQTSCAKSPPTRSTLITMSDGVELSANYWLPGVGKYPTILHMTPYAKAGATAPVTGTKAPTSRFVPRPATCYAYVAVDIRGTGASGGDFCIFCLREQMDGKEVVEWIAEQEWSDKKVGMIGGSYAGITALFTAAQFGDDESSPLKAIAPAHVMSDPYRDAAWHNGLFSSFFVPQWAALQTQQSAEGSIETPRRLTERGGSRNPMESRSEEWDGPLYRERALYLVDKKIAVPTFLWSGWFDGFSRGTIRTFQGISSANKILVMDPFGHHYGSTTREPFTRYWNEWDGNNDLSETLLREWFDYFLKGEDVVDAPPGGAATDVCTSRSMILAGSAVCYYDLGSNEWKSASDWPPSGTQLKTLYLSGEDAEDATSRHRGSLVTDGSLVEAVLGEDGGSDVYVYDPVQGISDALSKWGEVAASPQMLAGQRPDEVRALSYTTPPLEEPLPLAGPLELKFYASTTAKDMDWVVKVSDVPPEGEPCTALPARLPDDKSVPNTPVEDAVRQTYEQVRQAYSHTRQPGNSCLLTSGYLRASHREVDEGKSLPAEPWIINELEHVFDVPNALTDPDPVVEYRIDIWPIASTLQPGHQLRITIMSSDVPSHEPSPYAGVNEIFHDARYPSRLIVTTIPNEPPEVEVEVTPDEVSGNGPVDISASVSDDEGVSDVSSIDVMLRDRNDTIFGSWSLSDFVADGIKTLRFSENDVQLAGPSPWTVALTATDTDGASASDTATIVRIEEGDNQEGDDKDDEDQADTSEETTTASTMTGGRGSLVRTPI